MLASIHWSELFRPCLAASAFSIAAALPAATQAADLTSHPLRVVYAEAWDPISVGHGDAVKGIFPHLVDEILGQRLGIKVDHRGVPWGRAQEMIQAGEADAFITAPTPARLDLMVPSQQLTYFLGFNFFTRIGTEADQQISIDRDIPTPTTWRFCEVFGNGWGQYYYAQHKIDYFEAPTVTHCLKMLALDRADVVIHAAPVGRLALQRAGLQGTVHMLPDPVPESPTFAFLVRKDYPQVEDLIAKIDQLVGELRSRGEWAPMVTKIVEAEITERVSP